MISAIRTHIQPAPEPQPRQVERPEDETANKNGFFMLSHGVFSDPRLQALTGDAFKLYLWMSCQAWRYKNSAGFIRASRGFISTGTGLSIATVSRGLQTLLKAKLVRLSETDYSKGNTWFVTSYALPKTTSPILKAVQFEPSQNEHAQIDTAPYSKRAGTLLNLIQHPAQNEHEIRSTNKTQETKRNSLSASDTKSTIEDYLDSLKSAEKRKREERALKGLRKDFPEEEIERALAYLKKSGIPSSGEACHSPMAYLALAIDEILSHLRKVQEKEIDATAKKNRIQESETAKDREEEQELEEARLREACFLKAFPTPEECNPEILKMASRFPMLDSNGPIVRNLAISAWWASRGSSLELRKPKLL